MLPASTAALLPEWYEPEEVAAGLVHDEAPMFWLDAGPRASTGWSWVGRGQVEPHPDRVRETVLGDGSGGPDRSGDAGPFRGGWIGWAEYDAGAARAGAPQHPGTSSGGQAWIRAEGFYAFDHARRRVWAISPGGDLAAPRAVRQAEPGAPSARSSSARHTAEEYAALIARCREHIREGDAYQLCLTTQFRVEGATDAWATYRLLRRAAPSHHGGFVRVGERALLSASPEQFLEVAGGVVRTRPIKGTRPRGAGPAADLALADELRADPKERAENVMIVDLMRNDLSRVCAPGAVVVERLLEVETYPPLHQLVSTVSGRLRPRTRLGDLLDATFPAGSMTGAPKLSAMTILADLERGPRGLYAGCFGWIGHDGAADLAMTIRSIVVDADGATVGAGGGITWRSAPAAEVAEAALKARAPLAALGATVPPGW